MKIFLGIIAALTFLIGVMLNKMAITVGEQVYAAMYYIMALISFCTLAILLRGSFRWNCDWLKRECGIDDDRENAKIEEADLSGVILDVDAPEDRHLRERDARN